MSRVKTPDGKRVLLALKVSEGTAAAVDHARGDLRRGQWLEALIDKALAAEGISTAPPDSVPPVIPVRKPPARRGRGKSRAVAVKAPEAVPAHPLGMAIFQDPGGEAVITPMPPAPAADRRTCNHPGTRLIGGYCKPCDHPVAVVDGSGKAYWRIIPGHCPECERLIEAGCRPS